jgi:hypothetical protein
MERSNRADQLLDREEIHYQAMLKSVGPTVHASAVGGTVGPTELKTGPTLSDSAIAKIADAVLQLAKLGVRGDPFDAVCARLAMDPGGLSPDYRQMLRDCRDQAQSGEVSVAVVNAASAGSDANALSSLNSQADLFIQVANESQREGAYALNQGVKVSIGRVRTNKIEVVGPERATKATVIRYYFDKDKEVAAALSRLFAGPLGSAPICEKMPSDRFKNVKPGLIELWLASNAVIDAAKAVSVTLSTNEEPHQECTKR